MSALEKKAALNDTCLKQQRLMNAQCSCVRVCVRELTNKTWCGTPQESQRNEEVSQLNRNDNNHN